MRRIRRCISTCTSKVCSCERRALISVRYADNKGVKRTKTARLFTNGVNLGVAFEKRPVQQPNSGIYYIYAPSLMDVFCIDLPYMENE